MSFDKKVYTMEDNVKYIAFGIKDLVKAVQGLDNTLQQMQSNPTPSKNDDRNEFPS